jgi:FkbM family methyltransferase
MSTAARANEFLRHHPRALSAAHRLTIPARRTPLPVLAGNGRGLRVRVGPSTLTRIVSRIETEVEDALLHAIQPGDVVYDVGANIGWFSLLAARRVGPTGQVVAFEPAPANVRYIRSNATSNRLANIVAVPAAVSDHDGWGDFIADGSLKGHLGTGGDPVPVVSLDTWAASHAPPSVLKIDVEGAEGAVLRGMLSTLHALGPTLIIELHDTGTEVADLLDSAGYSHRPIGCDGATRDAPWWAHVLASPA